MTTKTDTEQLRAEFEAWCREKYNNPGMERAPDGYAHTATHQLMPMTYASVQMLWEAYRAGRAALQSQDREDAERWRTIKEQSIVTFMDDSGRKLMIATLEVSDFPKPLTMETFIDHARRIEGDGK